LPTTVPVQVQVTGEHTPHIAEYAEQRVRSIFRFAHEPVLAARIRVVRHRDPASPVTAQCNLDVNGHLLRAQVSALTATEAVDRLRDSLRRRLQHHLERVAGHWEARRRREPSSAPHERGSRPSLRLPYHPQPSEKRQVIRHKSFALARCDADEAAFDMEALDYDFHLFTELGTGQDSVLHHAGPEGYRLAQIAPDPESLAGHAVVLTVSRQPTALLSTAEAVDRMACWDRPFLFFLDADRGRGAVLYHRYDGHYGLITPAE
jgi:ribosome-associated translation inhibitor RaiA